MGKCESMLHKFKTNTLDTIREEVFIDGERIRCTDYVLSHSVGEVSTLDISLAVETDMVSECEVRIKNKEQFARLMNKSEFEKFCEIWKKLNE